MSHEVTLPALGESVTEGTVSRWLKAVGETVERDEPLVEVSTDKVDTEVPSPVAGVVLEIRVHEDETVGVGGVLAVIGEPTEAAAPAVPAEPAPAAAEPVPDPSGWIQAGSTWAPSSAPEPITAPSFAATPAFGPPPTYGPPPTFAATPAPPAPFAPPAPGAPAFASPVPAAPPAPEPLSAPRFPAAPVFTTAASATPPAAVPGGPGFPAPQPPAPPAAPAGPAPTPSSAYSPVAPRDLPAPVGAAPYVTPLVRKIADQSGVDLAAVAGSGVGGRIRKQDVLEAAGGAGAPALVAPPQAAPLPGGPAAPAPLAVPAPVPVPAAPVPPVPASQPSAPVPAPAASRPGTAGTREKITRLRATIARRMVESLQVSAQLTATVEVDLSRVARLRAQVKNDFKAREGISLTYLPFIAKAAVEALKAYPKVNAAIDTEAGEIIYPDGEHLGIAVDTPRGLLVPVIRHADELSITGLAKKIADLSSRTRANQVTPDELGGGTFTITNYGSAGTLFDTPIINQPQVAILGTGAIVRRPVVVDDPRLGEIIAVCDMMYLSMSYDHRLVDGADAARFLSTVKARLEAGDFGAEF